MSAANAQLPAAFRRHVPVRARQALAVAALLVVALIACWYGAFHSVRLARADANAYFAFDGLSTHHALLREVANWCANLCQPSPFVYLAAIPVSVALMRRRWVLAVALMVMIAGSVEMAELLKALTAAPRPAVGIAKTPIYTNGSWPSGHSTASMALAMAYVLASPARWRPLVAAVGTFFALAVIYSVLTLGWHYPSDALGGILTASIWTLLAVAAVLCADARYGRDLSQFSARPSWLAHMPSIPALVLAAAVPALVVLAMRGGRALSYASHHTAFVVAAVGIAALGVSAPTALTWALGRGGWPARRRGQR